MDIWGTKWQFTIARMVSPTTVNESEEDEVEWKLKNVQLAISWELPSFKLELDPIDHKQIGARDIIFL